MLLALFTKPSSFWSEAVQDPGDIDHDRQEGTEASDQVLQVSVLRVMTACLDSIAVALSFPEHGPSRDLLLKYFTAPTVMNISDVFSEGVGHDVATALFLQIVATVWKLKEGAGNKFDSFFFFFFFFSPSPHITLPYSFISHIISPPLSSQLWRELRNSSQHN